MRPLITKTYCKLLSMSLTLLLVFNAHVLSNLFKQKSNSSQNDPQMSQISIFDNRMKKRNIVPNLHPSSNFMSSPIINKHSYNFINKPKDVCNNKSIDLLVAIESSVINFERRRLARRIRNTPPPIGIVYLFFLGQSIHLTGIQQRVDAEAKRYGDIVQENFDESPQNHTLLSVSVLKWVNEYCHNVKYVLKKIDDARLNLVNILQALRQKSNDYKDFVMGNSTYLMIHGIIKQEVVRYYMSIPEHQMSISEHQAIPFLMYLQGPLYGFPGSTALPLYQVSMRTKLFWREDVYISGICAHKANIPVFFDRAFYIHIN